MKRKGGVLVEHGYTHEWDGGPNPYNGATGDDVEFFRVREGPQHEVRYDGPLPGDTSPAWADRRIAFANREFEAAGIGAPAIFEFPHYAASADGYAAARRRFATRWERSFYFSGVLSGGRIDHRRHASQFFPYVVRDVYGSKVLPENLGSVNPVRWHTYRSRLPEDILRAARANLVVRDGFASFFFHPFLDLHYLKTTVRGIRALGYTFVDPSDLWGPATDRGTAVSGAGPPAYYSAPVGAIARRASSRHLLAVVTLIAAFAVGASPDAPGAFDPAAKPRRAAPSLQTIGYDRAPLGTPWLDRTGYEPWWSLHDGFGVTSVVKTAPGSRGMRLSTAAALTPSTTYSALVRTTRTWGDLDFTIRLRTLAQRRRGQPNPWEVGWLLWRYTDNDHFYSFIVKPNGFELGKQDPAYPRPPTVPRLRLRARVPSRAVVRGAGAPPRRPDDGLGGRRPMRVLR